MGFISDLFGGFDELIERHFDEVPQKCAHLHLLERGVGEIPSSSVEALPERATFVRILQGSCRNRKTERFLGAQANGPKPRALRAVLDGCL